jgi:3-methyladenine DNA glycosylase/8-oxoguanine DNA glycosylase
LAREEIFRPFLAPTPTPTPHAALRKRLLAVRGIGPWTTEMILGFGAGDPDAAITGDLHLPHLVTWALAGEPFGSDERMLALLEPFRGQRFRVTRLLQAAGLAVPNERR